jgi:signal transduction histidine kinase
MTLQRIYSILFTLFIVLSLSCGGIISASAQIPSVSDGLNNVNSEPMKILIFHSYYSTYEWSSDVTTGIMSSLDNSSYGNSDIYFEYMDAKRHSSPEYIASLVEVYKYKYKDSENFDLIICSDNYAIDFLTSEEGLAIFPPEIPVVFCGANNYDSGWLDKRPKMTGVVEYIEPAETLNFILEAHPDTKNLLVINDNHTYTAQIVRGQAEEAFAPYEYNLNINYLDDMTALQMQETVANVSDDTVIFLLLFNRDSEGKEVTMSESIGLIDEVAKVPVYSAWDFYLGKGIVGGKLTSARNEGKLAGEIAVRVLNGEKPANIPIMNSQYHSFMFDWDQLERFSISVDKLPEGSIIINKDPTFYELYRNEVTIISVVFIFLLSIVSLLLINRARLKATQAELMDAKERAEYADRLKSTFIANVSHELRTPLNGIIGFSEMLKMPHLTSEKQSHYADIIKSSGHQLLSLINDILDLSKIEAGQLTVTKKNFTVNYVLFDLYSIFKVQFDCKNPPVELKLDVELEDEDSVIFSDEQAVRQILTNLLGNAMKFTREGSVKFGYHILGGNMIEFYVNDTGIGIPEDKFDRVFGRFQQVDDETSRQYKGTGLGLSISKGLTQLLDGDIRFESEYGVGTSFYFTLPYEKEDIKNP